MNLRALALLVISASLASGPGRADGLPNQATGPATNTQLAAGIAAVTGNAAATPTRTATKTATRIPSRTATRTATATPTRTSTRTLTRSATRTPTRTASPTSTGYICYVAPNGSDSNSGLSRASPWRTIQHAANVMKPGETTIVLAGNYPERVTISNSGSAAARITFKTDGAATVIARGFEVRANYVTVSGFQITNQLTTDPEGYGLYVVGSNDTLSSNYIHDLYFEGIMVSGEGNPNSSAVARNTINANRIVRASMAGIHVEGQYNTVIQNDISWTRQYPTGGPRRDGADADGIRFFGIGHRIVLNNIHDIPYGTTENVDPHIDCFQTWGPALGITIERNRCVWSSTSEGTDNEVSSIENSAGKATGIIFRNNVFVNMRQGINVSDSSGLSVLNNTWDNVLEEAVILSASPEASIENNIFFNVGGGGDSYACIDSGSMSGLVIATNDHFMSQGPPGNYCSNAPYISLNPGFVELNALDFHLTPGSRLIDRGATLTAVPNDHDGVRRPQGKAYDIGAYEFH